MFRLRLVHSIVPSALIAGALATPAMAQDPDADAAPAAEPEATATAEPEATATAELAPLAAAPRRFKDIFHSFQVHVGLASAGPVLFNDTPDARLERITAFEYGGRLAFLFGQETLDLHRLGLGLAYDAAAASDSRTLRFLTPQLMYEIGHPLILELGLGYAAGLGTADYASQYSGFYSGAALRYSFRKAAETSPVSVSLGLTSKVVLAKEGFDQSTAFVGAEVELIFHKMPKGGAQ